MARLAKNFGESLVWRSSKRAWLGRQSARICLIALIDEASGRVLARFAEENSTPENLDLLGVYVKRFGRPMCIRTHRLSLFRGNPRSEGERQGSDAVPGRSQIRRALAELEIEWSPTESERVSPIASEFFKVAKRELARGLSRVRARTITDANGYLNRVYLPAWHDRHASSSGLTDVHRPVLAHQNLDAILSEVEVRTISPNWSVQFYRGAYFVPDSERHPDLCGAQVEVEKRRNGKVYLRTDRGCIALGETDEGFEAPSEIKVKKNISKPRGPRRFNRAWMQGFFRQPEPPLWRSLK
jgi:hypothetical protein